MILFFGGRKRQFTRSKLRHWRGKHYGRIRSLHTHVTKYRGWDFIVPFSTRDEAGRKEMECSWPACLGLALRVVARGIFSFSSVSRSWRSPPYFFLHRRVFPSRLLFLPSFPLAGFPTPLSFFSFRLFLFVLDARRLRVCVCFSR